MSRLTPEQHPLLSSLIVEALNGKQIFTVNDLMNTDSQQIINITRLTFQEVLELRNNLLEQSCKARPVNAYKSYKSLLNNSARIPTGIPSLDELLEGGLLTGHIYEICGAPASGKTQIGYTILKNLIVNLKQKAYYLDSNFNFLAVKMKNILEGGEVKFMEKILVKRLQTKNDLLNSLYEIKDDLQQKKLTVRLIIIDSLPILLMEENLNYNRFFTHLAIIMHFIATEYHVAFFVVNLLTNWTEGDFERKEQSVDRISCGKFWRNIPSTRLKIEKHENEKCEISILSSHNPPNNDKVDVFITSKGVLSTPPTPLDQSQNPTL